MYSKLAKFFIKLSIIAKDKNAAIQSSEFVALFLMMSGITIAVVVGIKKLLGDGETSDNGGILKKFKDAYERKQS